MDQNYLYTIATHALALTIAASALAKAIQSSNVKESRGLLLRIAGSRYFIFAEFFLAALLIAPLQKWVHAVCAVLITIVAILGAAHRFMHPEEECECFGSITPMSKQLYIFLISLIVACSCLVAISAFHIPTEIARTNYWILGASSLLLILIERKLRFDSLTGVGYAGKWNGSKGLQSISSSLVLGEQMGREVRLCDLARNETPILIVVVSTYCHACRQTFENLVESSVIISQSSTIAVVADKGDFYRSENENQLVQLIDTKSRIGRLLGVRARPFAVYLDSRFHHQVSPVMGSSNVKRLFSILSSIVLESADGDASQEPSRSI